MNLMLNFLFTILVISACIPALVWGGWEGRRTCIILFSAGIATGIATYPPLANPMFLLVIDLILAAALLRIAMKTDRYWPLWIFSLHLLSVMTFLAWRIVIRGPSIFQAVSGFWSVPQLVILCVGPILDNMFDRRLVEKNYESAGRGAR